MARQCGPLRIIGSFNGICFYRLEGLYYARSKTSLCRQRFREDSCFQRSRESCQRFAKGNRMASFVYRNLKKPHREYPVFCRLKSMAIRLFREGKEEEEVLVILRKQVRRMARRKFGKKQRIRPRRPKGVNIKGGPILIFKASSIGLMPPTILPSGKRSRRYAPV